MSHPFPLKISLSARVHVCVVELWVCGGIGARSPESGTHATMHPILIPKQEYEAQGRVFSHGGR